jgi:hypothetical protein
VTSNLRRQRLDHASDAKIGRSAVPPTSNGYPVSGGTETGNSVWLLTFRKCPQPTKRCISFSIPGRIASQPQHIFPPQTKVSRRAQRVVDIPHMIDTPNSWVVACASQLCPGYRPDHWIRCSPRRESLTASLWSPWLSRAPTRHGHDGGVRLHSHRRRKKDSVHVGVCPAGTTVEPKTNCTAADSDYSLPQFPRMSTCGSPTVPMRRTEYDVPLFSP